MVCLRGTKVKIKWHKNADISLCTCKYRYAKICMSIIVYEGLKGNLLAFRFFPFYI